jgi:GNAT superfamily N-acetyltransferase
LADEADAAVIARIHMTSRLAAMPYLPPQKRSHEQVSQWVRDVLLRHCRTWVAVRDAGIMGYAALDGDLLEHLYLRPEVRRQGIGTLLLDEVRRHSPDGVSLHVFQQNTEARAFYGRHGFTVVDTSDGDRNMENLPDMTLRWNPAQRGLDRAARGPSPHHHHASFTAWSRSRGRLTMTPS